jgi:hypothetical protein
MKNKILQQHSYNYKEQKKLKKKYSEKKHEKKRKKKNLSLM